MKTTLKELKIAEPSIQKLINQGSNLSAKYQYRLSFLVKELRDFDQQRDKLIAQLRDKYKGETELPKDEIDNLNKELDELSKEEVDVRFIKLDANDLVSRKNEKTREPLLVMTGDDWYRLAPFIEGEPSFEEEVIQYPQPDNIVPIENANK
jgi:hypothetical protein